MAKIKVARLIEYVGEPDDMKVQLAGSLPAGVHFPQGRVTVTITDLMVGDTLTITGEPANNPRSNEVIWDAVKKSYGDIR